jgi:hypothetical protein
LSSVVYALCFLTSCLCAVLLLRAYFNSRSRLLLWSGLCFVGLGLNNGLLLLDRVFLANVDMGWLRAIPAVIGVMFLLYGLVWESP